MSAVISEKAQELADLLTAAFLAGSGGKQLDEWVKDTLLPEFYPQYRRERIKKKQQAKGTPRLPEREWLPLTGAIYRRDGYECSYCETPEGPWCIDHVHPLSRGGSNDPDNLVVCCWSCNSSKKDKLVSEWSGPIWTR